MKVIAVEKLQKILNENLNIFSNLMDSTTMSELMDLIEDCAVETGWRHLTEENMPKEGVLILGRCECDDEPFLVKKGRTCWLEKYDTLAFKPDEIMYIPEE